MDDFSTDNFSDGEVYEVKDMGRRAGAPPKKIRQKTNSTTGNDTNSGISQGQSQLKSSVSQTNVFSNEIIARKSALISSKTNQNTRKRLYEIDVVRKFIMQECNEEHLKVFILKEVNSFFVTPANLSKDAKGILELINILKENNFELFLELLGNESISKFLNTLREQGLEVLDEHDIPDIDIQDIIADIESGVLDHEIANLNSVKQSEIHNNHQLENIIVNSQNSDLNQTYNTVQLVVANEDQVVSQVVTVHENPITNQTKVIEPLTTEPNTETGDIPEPQPSTSHSSFESKITQEIIDNVCSASRLKTTGRKRKQNVQLTWKDLNRVWIQKLFVLLFTHQEIIEGTISGKTLKQYDPIRICTIATFMGWLKSKTEDEEFTIQIFKKYEEISSKKNKTGLDEKEMEQLREVISHYSWTLRKREVAKQKKAAESNLIGNIEIIFQ